MGEVTVPSQEVNKITMKTVVLQQTTKNSIKLKLDLQYILLVHITPVTFCYMKKIGIFRKYIHVDGK